MVNYLQVLTIVISTALLGVGNQASQAVAAPVGALGFPAVALPGAADPNAPIKYYIVQEDADGAPEFLFEIAARYLGDGNRYREIVDINIGRPQPGGGALTDPEILVPGWVLQMPADAEGAGIVTGPLPTFAPEPAGDPQPSPEESDASASDEPAPTEDTSDEAGPSAPVDAREAGGSESVVPVIVGISALLVGVGAAAAALVWRRRRSVVPATPFDDSILRTDTSASWTVDRALRVLIRAAEEAGKPVPGVLGVFIEGPSVRLKLSSPASGAPDPWIASEDGQSWSAPISRLQREPVSDATTQEFARLVTVGLADTGRVLVNFGRARGLISLEGPPRATHQVLHGWLGELTGNPWSDNPRVVMIGNGLPRPSDAEQMSNLEQLAPELETEGRGILVLSQSPSSAQQSHLTSRFASQDFGWVVIVLSEMPAAKWRFTVDEGGTLRSSFLPDLRLLHRPTAHRGNE